MVFGHMVRHVLLGAFAPVLIWIAAPVVTMWSGLPQTLSGRTHGAITRATRGPLGRVVTHPLTAWLAATLTVIGWHVPAAFALAQQSEVWHGIQDASFFLTGLLFWWHVVQPWSASARLARTAAPLYLFAATLPCDALSAFLVFCDRVVYRQHPTEHGRVTMSALADQQAAGAFMWVSITIIYLVPALVIIVQTLTSPPRSRTARSSVDGQVFSGPRAQAAKQLDVARFRWVR